MKKIFILAGEESGDATGAWYVKQLKTRGEQFTLQGIGGALLRREGMQLYVPMSECNVVGALEIIRHLPRLIRLLRAICRHIIEYDYQEVILVDFPGFNLRLARMLKKLLPSLHITYVSPPQMWIWGAWRLKQLVKATDRRVVIYPFEVSWYQQRGVKVEFWGYPFYEQVTSHRIPDQEKKNYIAIVMASRVQELVQLGPIFIPVAAAMLRRYPDLSVVIPRAFSVDSKMLEAYLNQYGLAPYRARVMVVDESERKYELLAQCICALTKPGTVSLELALLWIPCVVGYKTSAFTFYLAKALVSIKHMALPNILLGHQVYEEFLQKHCSVDSLLRALDGLYRESQSKDHFFVAQNRALQELTKALCEQAS